MLLEEVPGGMSWVYRAGTVGVFLNVRVTTGPPAAERSSTGSFGGGLFAVECFDFVGTGARVSLCLVLSLLRGGVFAMIVTGLLGTIPLARIPKGIASPLV